MKKTILINVLSLLFAFTGRSQQTLFDSIYYNNSSTLNEEVESIWNATKYNSNVISVFLGVNFSNGNNISFLNITDSIGNSVFLSLLPTTKNAKPKKALHSCIVSFKAFCILFFAIGC